MAGGPYLEVEITCERSEERWIKLHSQLHSFIEVRVHAIVDDINAFIDSQRRHYTESEEWSPKGAQTKLTVDARDGDKCTFMATITLNAAGVPNEARGRICRRIADDVEKKFTSARFVVTNRPQSL